MWRNREALVETGQGAEERLKIHGTNEKPSSKEVEGHAHERIFPLAESLVHLGRLFTVSLAPNHLYILEFIGGSYRIGSGLHEGQVRYSLGVVAASLVSNLRALKRFGHFDEDA